METLNVLYRSGLTVWVHVGIIDDNTNTCRDREIPVDFLKVPVRYRRVLLLASIFSRKHVHFLVFKHSLMYNFCPSLLSNNWGMISCNFVMITLQLTAPCQIKLPSDSMTKLISSLELGNNSSTSRSKNECLLNDISVLTVADTPSSVFRAQKPMLSLPWAGHSSGCYFCRGS